MAMPMKRKTNCHSPAPPRTPTASASAAPLAVRRWTAKAPRSVHSPRNVLLPWPDIQIRAMHGRSLLPLQDPARVILDCAATGAISWEEEESTGPMEHFTPLARRSAASSSVSRQPSLGRQRPHCRCFRDFRRHLSRRSRGDSVACPVPARPAGRRGRSAPGNRADASSRRFRPLPGHRSRTFEALSSPGCSSGRHAGRPRLHVRPRRSAACPPVAALLRRRRHLHGSGDGHRLHIPARRLMRSPLAGHRRRRRRELASSSASASPIARMTDPQKIKDFLDIAAIPQADGIPA